MRESVDRVVHQQLSEEELEPFEDIINFIYKAKFSKLDPKSLLSVVMAADKFEVNQAMKQSIEFMLESELNLEAAVLYLEFSPANATVAQALAPVRAASGRFLTQMFKNVFSHKDDLLELPLSAILEIFRSSDLIVPNEDYVYLFLVDWVKKKYEDEHMRCTVFSKALVFLIRFMHMTIDRLMAFSNCPLMPNKVDVKSIISSAFLFKINCSTVKVAHWNYAQRNYLIRPVILTNLLPYNELLAYFDLPLADFARMSNPAWRSTYTEVFAYGGYRLFVQCQTTIDAVSNAPSAFGMFLCAQKSTQPEVLSVTFSVRQKPGGGYVDKFSFDSPFLPDNKFGVADLLLTPWAELLDENNLFLING
ncbi:unnamed protein product [Triticum turgidum subsp. durum]|uniref:BACK domain-containing protein n=1 Tax=Triticum turgidum subsp. durum TaxID=4567 RepID=A0A9R0YR06_TRITD|nr:unnamed protein product [Triticum turgidum subsp. durum]